MENTHHFPVSLYRLPGSCFVSHATSRARIVIPDMVLLTPEDTYRSFSGSSRVECFLLEISEQVRN